MALREAIAAGDADAADGAALGLAWQGDESGLDRLKAMAGREDTRERAVEALRRLKSELAADALRTIGESK